MGAGEREHTLVVAGVDGNPRARTAPYPLFWGIVRRPRGTQDGPWRLAEPHSTHREPERSLNPMSRTFALSLVVSLGLSALASPALAVDVAFDPSRIFLRYVTPATDSGAVLLPSINSASHPVVLPCDLTRYGVQVDARFVTGAGVIYPQLQSRYYTLPNSLVWSSGYEFGSTAPFSVDRSNVSPFEVGQTAIIGQMSIDAVDLASRRWLFQPSDLPANVTVRHSLHVSLFDDANYTHEVNDDVPSNNNRFVYLRRECQ